MLQPPFHKLFDVQECVKGGSESIEKKGRKQEPKRRNPRRFSKGSSTKRVSLSLAWYKRVENIP
jgi:hypothetical protein